jgi:hypothetical protein
MEFADKVNWFFVSYNQKISEGFIIEFYNKVNWNTLDDHNKINVDIFREMNREQKLYMIMNYRDILEKYNEK